MININLIKIKPQIFEEIEVYLVDKISMWNEKTSQWSQLLFWVFSPLWKCPLLSPWQLVSVNIFITQSSWLHE